MEESHSPHGEEEDTRLDYIDNPMNGLPEILIENDRRVMAEGEKSAAGGSTDIDVLENNILECHRVSARLLNAIKKGEPDVRYCVLVGPSRAGKSTLTNLLIGREPIVDDYGYIRFSDPFARISDSSVSETVIPNYSPVTKGWSLIDTPGINENRTPLIRSVVGMIVSRTIYKTGRCKILFVFNDTHFSPSNAYTAGECLLDACELLGQDTIDSLVTRSDSWGLVITCCSLQKKVSLSNLLKKQVDEAPKRMPWADKLEKYVAIKQVVVAMVDKMLTENIYCVSKPTLVGDNYSVTKVGDIDLCDADNFTKFMSTGESISANGLMPVIHLHQDFIRAMSVVMRKKLGSFFTELGSCHSQLSELLEAYNKPGVIGVVVKSPEGKRDLLASLDDFDLKLRNSKQCLSGLIHDTNISDRATSVVQVLGDKFKKLLSSWLGITSDSNDIKPPSLKFLSELTTNLKAVEGVRISNSIAQCDTRRTEIARLREQLAIESCSLKLVHEVIAEMADLLEREAKNSYRSMYDELPVLQTKVRDMSGEEETSSIYSIQTCDFDAVSSFSSIECVVIRFFDTKALPTDRKKDVNNHCAEVHASKLQDALLKVIAKGGTDNVIKDGIRKKIYDPTMLSLERALNPDLTVRLFTILKRKDRNEATVDDYRVRLLEDKLDRINLGSVILEVLSMGLIFDGNDTLTMSTLSRYRMGWAAFNFNNSFTNFLSSYQFGDGFMVGGDIRLLVIHPEESEEDNKVLRPVGWISRNGSDLIISDENPQQFKLCPVGAKGSGPQRVAIRLTGKSDERLANAKLQHHRGHYGNASLSQTKSSGSDDSLDELQAVSSLADLDLSGSDWSQLVVDKSRRLKATAEQSADPANTFTVAPTSKIDCSDDRSSEGMHYYELRRTSKHGNEKPLHLSTPSDLKVVSQFKSSFTNVITYPILVLGESYGVDQRLKRGSRITISKGYVIVRNMQWLRDTMSKLAIKASSSALKCSGVNIRYSELSVATRESVMGFAPKIKPMVGKHAPTTKNKSNGCMPNTR